MAIDDSRFIPEAPAFARSRPDAYYAWLTSNGFPHRVAYDQTTAIFGAPKSPEEQRKEAAAAQQQAGLAQAGGAVLGAVGTGYLASQLGGTAAATTPTLATPTVVGVKAVGAGTGAGAGTAGATTTGGVATGGGASGGAATTGGTTLGSVGSVALPIAGAALTVNSLWESGMKDILRGKADKADYTNIGLAAGTMGLSEVANIGLRMMGQRSIGSMMKSGKSGVQKVRDSFRSDLQASGVADDKYMVTLADGSKFNIGLDGKTKYQNVGKNIDGKKTRNAWDVDFSNPLAKFATDNIEPMIRNIYGPDDKKAKYMPGQFTGILVNAATSNAQSEQDVLANIQAMLGKSKFAQQAGVGVQPPPPPKPPKGEVVRVSPGMYMNDKGQVKPAKTVGEALKANYGKTKEKEKK
jgi:hypothetical protein